MQHKFHLKRDLCFRTSFFGPGRGVTLKNSFYNMVHMIFFWWCLNVKFWYYYFNQHNDKQLTISYIHILTPKCSRSLFFCVNFAIIIHISCQFPTFWNYKFFIGLYIYIVEGFYWNELLKTEHNFGGRTLCKTNLRNFGTLILYLFKRKLECIVVLECSYNIHCREKMTEFINSTLCYFLPRMSFVNDKTMVNIDVG